MPHECTHNTYVLGTGKGILVASIILMEWLAGWLPGCLQQIENKAGRVCFPSPLLPVPEADRAVRVRGKPEGSQGQRRGAPGPICLREIRQPKFTGVVPIKKPERRGVSVTRERGVNG